MAEAAINQFDLDALRCVPAGQPPHRDAPQTDAKHRLAMVTLAFTEHERCMVDDTEVTQTGPSWTIRTLERMRQSDPEASLLLILGADAVLGLPTWHRWQELLDCAHIAVANRPDSALTPNEMTEPLKSFWATHHTEDWARLRQQRAGCLVSFTIAPCKVSATQVRSNLRQGLSIDDLVPPAVEKYIVQHHLYPKTAQ